ncbi:MAG: peptidoglycan binding protein CsiV [Gammaproteobacteria bacterium]|nr:peptidoglycan binding protein CsiV [Gammaproteobacteria bacterium]
MRCSLLLPLLFTSIGLPFHTYANEDIRYYDIELVIFENLQDKNFQTEYWAQNIERPIPETFIDLNSELPEQLVLPENIDPLLTFKEIPGRDLRLLEEASKIEQSASRRVILHTAWVQPGLAHDKSISVHFNQTLVPEASVRSDQLENDATEFPSELSLQKYESASLDSLIRVSLARYLHVETDLLLTLDEEPAPLIESPFAQTESFIENAAVTTTDSREIEGGETGLRPLPRQVHIQQTRRRIRSNELHYLDHPLISMVILITPHAIKVKDKPAEKKKTTLKK